MNQRAENHGQLLTVLARAQDRGFLGPGDPAAHLVHALGFAEVAMAQLAAAPRRFADLGSGGGIPGLVLAVQWADSEGVLIESTARRCTALREWVEELGLEGRVRVLEGRAEDWAHDPEQRERFDLVTARSFARPAITAEIAAGLVCIGGIVVVSEPPESPPDRWPPDALGALGFEPALPVVADGAHYACLRKARPAGPSVPRAVGKPAKRPLW